MVVVDMWYGNKISEITEIDISFSDRDCKYRGNMYIGDKRVGDYCVSNSIELEKRFPHLKFNWE